MSNTLVIPKIGNELVLCMYSKYTVTIQTTNKFEKYTPTNLNKDQAIQLRNFLNEFIGENDYE